MACPSRLTVGAHLRLGLVLGLPALPSPSLQSIRAVRDGSDASYSTKNPSHRSASSSRSRA